MTKKLSETFINHSANVKIVDWLKLQSFADTKRKKKKVKKNSENCVGDCKKHCGKRRKCWFRLRKILIHKQSRVNKPGEGFLNTVIGENIVNYRFSLSCYI